MVVLRVLLLLAITRSAGCCIHKPPHHHASSSNRQQRPAAPRRHCVSLSFLAAVVSLLRRRLVSAAAAPPAPLPTTTTALPRSTATRFAARRWWRPAHATDDARRARPRRTPRACSVAGTLLLLTFDALGSPSLLVTPLALATPRPERRCRPALFLPPARHRADEHLVRKLRPRLRQVGPPLRHHHLRCVRRDEALRTLAQARGGVLVSERQDP